MIIPEGLSGLLFPALLLAVMYFMLIRPQQQQAKKRQAMLNELSLGDQVITIGGLHGTIVAFPDEGTILLEVGEGVQLTFNRAAVGSVRRRDDEPAATEAEG